MASSDFTVIGDEEYAKLKARAQQFERENERDAARYRWLASRFAHVSHPRGEGWTLDVVLTSFDRDLGAVIDEAIRREVADE
jgi:hypothetical protein